MKDESGGKIAQAAKYLIYNNDGRNPVIGKKAVDFLTQEYLDAPWLPEIPQTNTEPVKHTEILLADDTPLGSITESYIDFAVHPLNAQIQLDCRNKFISGHALDGKPPEKLTAINPTVNYMAIKTTQNDTPLCFKCQILDDNGKEIGYPDQIVNKGDPIACSFFMGRGSQTLNLEYHLTEPNQPITTQNELYGKGKIEPYIAKMPFTVENGIKSYLLNEHEGMARLLRDNILNTNFNPADHIKTVIDDKTGDSVRVIVAPASVVDPINEQCLEYFKSIKVGNMQNFKVRARAILPKGYDTIGKYAQYLAAKSGNSLVSANLLAMPPNMVMAIDVNSCQ
jgi:hypothetical protein